MKKNLRQCKAWLLVLDTWISLERWPLVFCAVAFFVVAPPVCPIKIRQLCLALFEVSVAGARTADPSIVRNYRGCLTHALLMFILWKHGKLVKLPPNRCCFFFLMWWKFLSLKFQTCLFLCIECTQNARCGWLSQISKENQSIFLYHLSCVFSTQKQDYKKDGIQGRKSLQPWM